MVDRMPEQIRLRQIVDRLTAISLGTWVAHTWDPMERPHVVVDPDSDNRWCCRGQYDLPRTKADAEFIAAAPADIGFLLARIDQLQAQVDRMDQTYGKDA